MTPKLCGLALALGAIFLLAPQTALAQYRQFYKGSSDNPVGPTVSPYLNLVQSSNSLVTNYQSLVKPLVDQGNAITRQANTLYRQGNSIRGLQQSQGGGGGGTGHASYFMNYSHYYPAAGR